MDEESRQSISDYLLRPIINPRSTNSTSRFLLPTERLKTELQVLRLSEESENMVMDTLKSIHGPDFQLGDSSKYKDRGGKLKKQYWEDRGCLIVKGMSDYSNVEHRQDKPEDRLRRYAIKKLESYGFPTKHCNEAFDYCLGQVDKALELLFCKYFKSNRSEESVDDSCDYSETELLEMRQDEKLALESIYDTAFVEKEKDHIWSLKFKIDHLLKKNKSKEYVNSNDAEEIPKNKKKVRCRNFAKGGHCKYGDKCRFAHIGEEKTDVSTKDENDKNMDDDWFYLEIRFPTNTKYPCEAPLTFLKTTSSLVSGTTLLRLCRKLYREAKNAAESEMPCIYTLTEFLQMDEEIMKFIEEDKENLPDPLKSLFATEKESVGDENIVQKLKLPTHYELGSTGSSGRDKITPEQLCQENQKLVKNFLTNCKGSKYQEMLKLRQSLPAWNSMLEILNVINTFQVTVISGETGCGKSTQVPQFILDNWLFTSSKLKTLNNMPHCEVICTQPRRLSAIGVAERVAEERDERIGKTIGYQIRLENKISSLTRLTFCTTGILLRRLSSDPLLESVTHIIVDEVHERSEESDFLLLILKKILLKRKDLKVILMSATLNAKLFSDYFGEAPILEIPGRTYPVKQIFLEEIIELSNFVLEPDSQYCRRINKKEEQSLLDELVYADAKADNEEPPKSIKDENLSLAALYARYSNSTKSICKTLFLMDPMKINPELIESVLQYIVFGDHDWPHEGAILIFLPGYAEIQAVYDALCDNSLFTPRAGQFILIPLHSTLSNEEQGLVFQKPPPGKRKIVLSTNIAETSVTIDDCVFVIDTGLMKEKRFDANKNMESLDLVWESRANAMQRKGRAGRVMPGVCIHLFTSNRFYKNMLSEPVPEIHRVPLEQLILKIKTLPNFQDLNVMQVIQEIVEPPTDESVLLAIERLKNVGAFDEEENLTPLGHHLSTLPVDVRIGKFMLLGTIFQCIDSVLTIAACLSNKSPFVTPFNKIIEADKRKKDLAVCNSDHLTVLIAYKRWLEASKKSRYSGRCFADENFLSWRTLETIVELKYQFLELLISIGFVPINLPPKKKLLTDNILAITGHNLNCNGENNRLLTSLLCAALYPNIVKVLTPEKSFTMTAGGAMPRVVKANELRFKTREDGYVFLHPSSVNANIGNFLSPYLIYQEKVKTSKIFIRECTMVPILPLIIFAGSDLKIELHAGDFLILLENGWIIFKAHDYNTAELIQCLRQELLKLLEEKIRDPCLNLLNHENGKKIIATIIYLISKD